MGEKQPSNAYRRWIGTACSDCPAGTYAGANATLCWACPAGQSDHDSNAASLCTSCGAGRYSVGAANTDCEACLPGRFLAVSGSVSIQACENCAIGQYAGPGSSACDECVAGRADSDTDPSTPCALCAIGKYAGCGATACETCAPGSSDSDSDPATPCARCRPGEVWSEATKCASCPAGKADTDADSTTGCDACGLGEYAPAGATACANCASLGRYGTISPADFQRAVFTRFARRRYRFRPHNTMHSHRHLSAALHSWL